MRMIMYAQFTCEIDTQPGYSDPAASDSPRLLPPLPAFFVWRYFLYFLVPSEMKDRYIYQFIL